MRAVEEERRKWIFFSDKVEILERQLNELKVEILERQLNEFRFVTLLNELDRAIPDSNFSEIVVTNTPKGQARSGTSDKKPRTPLPSLTCDVGNCSFSSKYVKRMRDHKTEAHELTVDESMMDNSVNVSALGLDMTHDNVASPDSQEEAKVHEFVDEANKGDKVPSLRDNETGRRRGPHYVYSPC